MIHDFSDYSTTIPYSIILFKEDIKRAINNDILAQTEKGGVKRLSSLGKNSEFKSITSIHTIDDLIFIKATTHYNQLTNNILRKCIFPVKKKMVLLICNREFNNRHHLFDSSSTSLEYLKDSLDAIKTVVKADLFPKNIYVIEIDEVTYPGQIVSTRMDERTFIEN